VTTPSQTEDRRRWMGLLARSPTDRLEAVWAALSDPPAYERLRGPEIGLVMLRGRAGGTGGRFNMGEMSVTRCTVRLADGRVGHGWVQGRDRRKAELAAAFDGLLQDEARRADLEAALLGPAADALAARRDAAARKAAATRVEFFTLVRGDNPR
jgi:alpha-D-ribose 1-methylphosphonate 5-triphosphate synthase subunit PhnG